MRKLKKLSWLLVAVMLVAQLSTAAFAMVEGFTPQGDPKPVEIISVGEAEVLESQIKKLEKAIEDLDPEDEDYDDKLQALKDELKEKEDALKELTKTPEEPTDPPVVNEDEEGPLLAPADALAPGSFTASAPYGDVLVQANGNDGVAGKADYTIGYQAVELAGRNITINFGSALTAAAITSLNIDSGGAIGDTTIEIDPSGAPTGWDTIDLTLPIGSNNVTVSFVENAKLDTNISSQFGKVYFAVSHNPTGSKEEPKKFYDLLGSKTYIDCKEDFGLIFVPAAGYTVNAASAKLLGGDGTTIELGGSGFFQESLVSHSWDWMIPGPNQFTNAKYPDGCVTQADLDAGAVMFRVNASSVPLNSTTYEFKLSSDSVTKIEDAPFEAETTGGTELSVVQTSLNVYVYDHTTVASDDIEIEVDTALGAPVASSVSVTGGTGTIAENATSFTVPKTVTSFTAKIGTAAANIEYTFHIVKALTATASVSNAAVTGNDGYRNTTFTAATSFLADQSALKFTVAPVGSTTTAHPTSLIVKHEGTTLTDGNHYNYNTSNREITFTAAAPTFVQGDKIEIVATYTASSTGTGSGSGSRGSSGSGDYNPGGSYIDPRTVLGTVTVNPSHQTWYGESSGLRWTIPDTNPLALMSVSVDGDEIDRSNYTVRSGSTIVTLKASYLETLKKGDHKISFRFLNSKGDATFTISSTGASAGEPTLSTGDSSGSTNYNPSTGAATAHIPMLVVMGMMAAAAAVLPKRK